MKDITTDLTDRLELLEVRYAVVFGAVPPAGQNFGDLAAYLIAGLQGQDPAPVVSQVRAAVDPADLAGTAFWGTPLGRLLFVSGGFFGETITQTVAAGLLSCSRQWVNAMVAEGKLTQAPERGVYVAEVRGVLEARAQRCEALKEHAKTLGN